MIDRERQSEGMKFLRAGANSSLPWRQTGRPDMSGLLPLSPARTP